MAEGTFTLVDDRIFLPRVDLHENNKINISSNTNKSKHVSKSNQGEKSKTHSHRKVSRRKISKKNPKMRKKEKKKCLFSKSNIKIETNFQNGFEFCTTVNDNIEIKQEICSETEIKVRILLKSICGLTIGYRIFCFNLYLIFFSFSQIVILMMIFH